MTRPVGGPPSKAVLSDAELLCLVVAQHLLHGHSSEARWVRYARTHLAGGFPGIPQQSGYNKRVASRRDADLRGDHGLGQGHRILARGPAPARFDPSTVRHQPRNGQTLGAGRGCRLRILRLALALFPGLPACI